MNWIGTFTNQFKNVLKDKLLKSLKNQNEIGFEGNIIWIFVTRKIEIIKVINSCVHFLRLIVASTAAYFLAGSDSSQEFLGHWSNIE